MSKDTGIVINWGRCDSKKREECWYGDLAELFLKS